MRLPAIYDWKIAMAIIGIMGMVSIFFGNKISGIILIFIGIFNFIATSYNSLKKKKMEKKRK